MNPSKQDLMELAQLPPIDVVGTDDDPSAEPPDNGWDPIAHADMLSADPVVELTEVPDPPDLPPVHEGQPPSA